MAGDWLFAARAVAAMKDGGRAAVILPPSAIIGAASEPYRRYFIQRNLIEAVVELPIRIFEHTGVVTYLVVFKKGSESIKMVRSGDLCEKGRRNNVIKEEHIRVIRGALGYESIGRKKFLDYVVEVSKQKILENDCDLSVRRLFDDSVTVKNGVAFSHFINSAKRGATITSAELDDVACSNETGFLYLAPGNISDGVIDSKLMNLKEIPKKYEGYCAKTGDLIIARVSASGAGFRVVVVEVPDDKMILPNGNLFVISINKKLADPYFIKACLDNDYAQRYLQKTSVGSSVVTLNSKSLEDLPIPDMPRERQKEIAKACRARTRLVAEFREKLACEKQSLRNVLLEIAPECINVSN
jgi:type I restriction enzyme M protein